MIKARHNPLVYKFFQSYASIRIRSAFHQVVVHGDTKPTGNSILLLSNHISWWDGFCALYLSMYIFNKKFHFMMDEEELSKRWLFSLSGGYSIRPTSRSLFESLQYTEELLSNPDNIVVIYPQGKLYSSHTAEIKFKRGIERIRFSEKSKPDICFLVQLTDYFQFEKPTLYFYLKKVPSERSQLPGLEVQYNDFYKQCIEQHSKIVV